MSESTPGGLSPVAENQRISSIDTARGFALLGIFMVNILVFALPFGEMAMPTPPMKEGLGAVVAYYAQMTLCTGKFYPLFSLLFGMGLALQAGRAIQKQRPYKAVYLRRLAVLLVIGLIHALLIWYGDILVMYAVAGTIALLCVRARPKTLIRVAIGLVLFIAVVGSLFATYSMGAAKAPVATIEIPVPGQPTDAPASTDVAAAPTDAPVSPDVAAALAEAKPDEETREVAQAKAELKAAKTPEEIIAAAEKMVKLDWKADGPFFTLMGAMSEQKVRQPQDPVWKELETRAYRDGPWRESQLFRAMSWVMIIIIMLISFVWHVVAMMFIGIAMVKTDFFSPAWDRFRRRWVIGAALIAVPLCAAGTYLATLHTPAGAFLATATNALAGPVISIGYLCAWTLIMQGGAVKWLTRAFAATGRMALTNYLTQSLVSTFVFYHWGLGKFGSFETLERVGFVAGVYVCQVIFSLAWMSMFRFGPMEWLWRSLTYLRPQPMLRAAGIGDAAPADA